MIAPDTASVKCLGSPGCSERYRELLLLKGSCGWKAGSLSGNHVDGDLLKLIETSEPCVEPKS